MVISHVPANAPSHMRQTIGLESAAACTSMYDGSHPWANDGPIFVVVREPIRITPDSTTAAGRGRLEFGKTIGPPSATACGPQEFCPPARVRAKGGSCSAANGVSMVSR